MGAAGLTVTTGGWIAACCGNGAAGAVVPLAWAVARGAGDGGGRPGVCALQVAQGGKVSRITASLSAV